MADSRDWDKEMAEIDRLMKKQGIAPEAPPAAGPAASPKAVAPGRKPAAARTSTTPAMAGTAGPTALTRTRLIQLWGMAALGPLGVGGLLVWPYPAACGTGLAVYLAGVGAVFAAGGLTMRGGWTARRGRVLVVGLATLLGALTLAAMAVLPRIGYAAEAFTWTCST